MNNYFVFVCCDANGQYRVFKDMPTRDNDRKKWTGEKDSYAQVALYYLEGLGIAMPDLTWKDEPMKVEIAVNYGNT